MKTKALTIYKQKHSLFFYLSIFSNFYTPSFGAATARKCSIMDLKDGKEQIKCVLADFGCSFVCKNDNFIVPKKVGDQTHQISGSTFYFPREVLNSVNSISSNEIDYSKSDLFAVGLTCYLLISKKDPFGGVDAEKRKKGDYVDIKNNYSQKTKDLLKKICCVDKNERYSVESALKYVREIRGKIKK